MTTKELIREKIDSFYAEYKAKFHQNGEPYNFGIIDGLDMAERILDTLPDEPVTDCNDLEDEIREYMSNEDNNPFDWDWRDKRDCARHFAQWGAEHLAGVSKTISEDLEEAAENSWAVYEYRESPKGLYSTCYVDGFIAGAEMMKAKMIKEDVK